MKYAVYILMGLNVLFWGGLTWIGGSLVQGVIRQHVHGYPTSRQIAFGIGFPAGVLVVILMLLVFLLVKGQRDWLIPILIGALCLLPLYLYGYGGGV